jgi:ribosomal protein S18 acetylase RimI-like enzyme
MTIRKFTPGDAGAVSRVMGSAFRSFLKEKFTDLDRKRMTPSFWRRTALVKGAFSETVSFVAEDQGRIIGYIKVTADRNGLGSLEVIGVSPDCFNKGVGRLLMKEAEKFWRKKALRKISTCVSSHNTGALIYYLKNGFIPVGYRKDHFRVGVDEIIMDRFLK